MLTLFGFHIIGEEGEGTLEDGGVSCGDTECQS